MPTSRKKTFDDLDRPALESVAMYFRFKDKTVEELRDLFEAKRDSLGNKSFADITDFDEMDKVARQKLWNRWTRFRKSQYLHLDSTLPRQTSDWDAFLMVEEHLVRMLESSREDRRSLAEVVRAKGA